MIPATHFARSNLCAFMCMRNRSDCFKAGTSLSLMVCAHFIVIFLSYSENTGTFILFISKASTDKIHTKNDFALAEFENVLLSFGKELAVKLINADSRISEYSYRLESCSVNFKSFE